MASIHPNHVLSAAVEVIELRLEHGQEIQKIGPLWDACLDTVSVLQETVEPGTPEEIPFGHVVKMTPLDAGVTTLRDAYEKRFVDSILNPLALASIKGGLEINIAKSLDYLAHTVSNWLESVSQELRLRALSWWASSFESQAWLDGLEGEASRPRARNSHSWLHGFEVEVRLAIQILTTRHRRQSQ